MPVFLCKQVACIFVEDANCPFCALKSSNFENLQTEVSTDIALIQWRFYKLGMF